MHSQPGLCPCGAPENLSSLDLGRAWHAGSTGTGLLQGSLEPEQCRPRKYMPPWAGANPAWSHTGSAPPTHTRQWHLFAVSLPTDNITEQVNPNKRPPSPPCVRAEIRHWRGLQTEEAKIKKREQLWKWQVQQIKTLSLTLRVHWRGPPDQLQAGTRKYLKLNYTTLPTTAPEKFLDIFLLLSLFN